MKKYHYKKKRNEEIVSEFLEVRTHTLRSLSSKFEISHTRIKELLLINLGIEKYKQVLKENLEFKKKFSVSKK